MDIYIIFPKGKWLYLPLQPSTAESSSGKYEVSCIPLPLILEFWLVDLVQSVCKYLHQLTSWYLHKSVFHSFPYHSLVLTFFLPSSSVMFLEPCVWEGDVDELRSNRYLYSILGPVMSHWIIHCPLKIEASPTKVESSTNVWVQTNIYKAVGQHDHIAK